MPERSYYSFLGTSPEIRETSTQIIEPNGGYHFDPLGGWSEEDTLLHLKYYADEVDRSGWRSDWPEMEIPPHEDPPHDRDSRLPKRPGWS